MKVIEIAAAAGHWDTIKEIATQAGVETLWSSVDENKERMSAHLLVSADKRQALMDALMRVLGTSEDARILVLPVEAVLPRREPEPEDREDKSAKAKSISREELYESIERGAYVNRNFLLLVFLSTIVAAIGLIEDNVAVVIGAMVIAPLLGPNLALALATSLGDTRLAALSARSNLAGIALAILIAIGIGLSWPVGLESRELLARTVVGLDSVALALASGAAAVLSLTTGLPSVLVGVMVAVALLPPASAFGLMLGAGRYDLAVGAGLLLAVNIVCVNLSAKLVFLMQGVTPRGWLEKKKAQQSKAFYIALWVVTLAILVALILIRDQPLITSR